MKAGRAPLMGWAWIAAAAAGLACAAAVAQIPEAPRLPDPLGPLSEELPDNKRTEAQQDRVDALAFYAAARMLERKGEYEQALRNYQRSYLFDPASAETGRSIVTLAFGLRRRDVAARYALTLAPDDFVNFDTQVLRILGVDRTKQRDWRQALRLYQRALAAEPAEKPAVDDVFLWMEMGRISHLVDEYGQASDCFARVLKALENPDDYGLTEKDQEDLRGEAWLTFSLLGECFLRAERLPEAEAAFRRSHQEKADEALLHFNMARILARRDKPAEALEELQACLVKGLSSEGMAPCELLAELLDKLGRKEELRDRIEKLHKDDPQNIPVAYYLAQLHLEAQRWDDAEGLYAVLAKMAPTPAAFRGLARIYRKTQRAERLLGLLGQAVTLTGMLETLGDEAEAIAADGPLIDGLLKAARERLADESTELTYGESYAVAMLALEAERFDAAGELFESALKAEPKQMPELLLVWGVGLLFGERPGEAARVFQRLIDEQAQPANEALFHSYLARALALDDRTEEALAAARKAIELDDAPRFHGVEAWVLYRARRNREAAAAFAAMVEKFDANYGAPEDRETLREARLSLSHLCVLDDNLPQAEEWLLQALDEFPGDIGACNDLGYLWADQGKRLGRSLRMIRKAVEAEPDNTAYRDSLGWALHRLGRHEEALGELEKASAGGDAAMPDGVILDHLGEVCRALNRGDEAKDAWRRAAECFRRDGDPQQAEAMQKKIEGL